MTSRGPTAERPTDRSTTDDPARVDAWTDACLVAALIAVDPAGLGGVRVRARAGPVRDAWLARWRTALDAGTPIRPIPLHIDDGRLLGGVDLTASLRSGRSIHRPGVLTEASGGFVVLAMAERVEPATAARIAAAIDGDDPDVRAQPGKPSAPAIIALDEGNGDDERLASSLAERVALAVDLHDVPLRVLQRSDRSAWSPDTIGAARARLGVVTIDDASVAALCEAAWALGIDSLRMPLFAVRAARALAALGGREAVGRDDAAAAARLVYAARARRLPAAPDDEPDERSGDAPASRAPTDVVPDIVREAPNDRPRPDVGAATAPTREATSSNADRDDAADPASRSDAIAEVVLEAAVAAIPAGLLRMLATAATAPRSGSARPGGSGARGAGRLRGTPAGIRRARPRSPERLSVIDTLRAAAPWQRVRRAEAEAAGNAAAAAAATRSEPDAVPGGAAPRVHVRIEDLHVVRYQQRHPTTTVFVVDASGSSALHRLAEAKGAVELLLAECYVRRDRVAVLAFRGKTVDLLLPPTRSLVRARRSLAGLPGGGGTPLANALDATRELAVALRNGGDTVLAVLLTDGRANVARDGSGGRPKAEADAAVAARALRAAGVETVLIDTSPQPHRQAAALAEQMGALYRPLPHAGAVEMSTIVQQTTRNRAAARSRR